MDGRSLRRQFLLSTTMLIGALTGYARQAYAACTQISGATYQCSGVTTSAQTINHYNAAVSTQSGFSVNAATGDAITITGDGALSYTDNYGSSLTANGSLTDGLYVKSAGDHGATPGSVNIYATGAITGGFNGIRTYNQGSGTLTVTANGDATGSGTNGVGIAAKNYGTDLTITTAAGTTALGKFAGIYAHNYGTGTLTVTANGDVKSTGPRGQGDRAKKRVTTG